MVGIAQLHHWKKSHLAAHTEMEVLFILAMFPFFGHVHVLFLKYRWYVIENIKTRNGFHFNKTVCKFIGNEYTQNGKRTAFPTILTPQKVS